MENKKFKPLPILLVLFVIVSSLCISIGYAWYAMNSSVSRTGVSLNATVTPNLVIAEFSNNIKGLDVDNGPFKVERKYTIENKFLPCTHLSTATNGSTDLVYISNTGDIDPETGLASGGYVYEDVLSGNAGNSRYFYMEYKVYIAAANKEMTDATLSASLTGEYKDLDGNVLPEGDDKDSGQYNYNTFNAASVDFYVGGVYKGTLNVAGKDSDINDGSTTKESVDLITDGTIPLNTAETNNYIEVTMRFYYDGALLKDAETAYVNTLTVTTEFAVLDIKFSAS